MKVLLIVVSVLLAHGCFGFEIKDKDIKDYVFQVFVDRGDQDIWNEKTKSWESYHIISKATATAVDLSEYGFKGFTLLSAGHVVGEHYEKIEISIDGKLYEPEILKVDKKKDLVLFRITHQIKLLHFRGSNLEIKDQVRGAGYPLGGPLKIDSGKITHKTFYDDLNFEQSDVPIKQGDSGGAIIDSNSDFAGIICKYEDGEFQAIFASIESIKEFLHANVTGKH